MEETFDQMNTPPDDLDVVSVTILISTKPVGAEENWWVPTWVLRNGNTHTGDLGLIAGCLQDDVQCLKHAQTFPDKDPSMYSTYADADTHRPFELVCATETSDLKESLIMGWPDCLDSRDEWSSPWEIVQGIGNVAWEREKKGGRSESPWA